MTMDEHPRGGWNLFARVLQEILTAHGYGLGYLDDRAGMHPEKVRRLQRSLKVPKSFPVLNIYEMEQVKSAFRLNREESLRLRATLLAISIEETPSAARGVIPNYGLLPFAYISLKENVLA
jgi:hypothetical protein